MAFNGPSPSHFHCDDVKQWPPGWDTQGPRPSISSRVSWDVLLTQLEYVVPAKVGLTTVSFGGVPGATGASTVALSLGGTAFSLHDVAVFVSTLARVPKISQVTLVSAAANTGSSVLTFQITAQVTLPATAVTPVTADTTTTGGSA